MPRRKRPSTAEGAALSDAYDSDDAPPLKRRRVASRRLIEDSEEDDPSYEPENTRSKPVKHMTCSTEQRDMSRPIRQARKVAGAETGVEDPMPRQAAQTSAERHTFKPSASRQSGFTARKGQQNLAAGFQDDDEADYDADVDGPMSEGEGAKKAGALGITWKGVSTESAEMIGIFCAAWKNRDYAASKLENLIEAQDQKIEDLEEKLVENKVDAGVMQDQRVIIRTLKAVVSKDEEQLRFKDESIAEKDKQIVEKNKEIADKDRQIADKNKQITDMDKPITEKDKENVEKDKENVEKDKENVEKDERIGERDENIAKRSDKIAERYDRLAEKDNKMAEMAKRMAEPGRRIAELENVAGNNDNAAPTGMLGSRPPKIIKPKV